MELALTIDTTADAFAGWLVEETLMAPYREFHTGKARIALQTAKPPHHIAGPTRIDLHAFYITVIGEDTEEAWPLPELISFRVLPLPPGQLQVRARCNHPAVMDYYGELLRAMARTWRRAREQLAKRQILSELRSVLSSAEWLKWTEELEEARQLEACELGALTAMAKVEEEGREAAPIKQVRQESTKPWEAIPEGWERQAVKLWWEGSPKPEIARSLGLAPKTVENRFSQLRRTYGRQIVPKLDDLRKLGIRP